MNPVVLIHLLAALLTIAAALPLILRRVRMNHWYGVRVPAAFASEEAWFAINRYGGRLLLGWGGMIALIALVGALLEREAWLAYNWTSLGLILGGLAFVGWKIFRFARNR